ncbi:hypothetical protein [Stappia sp.]|jgi:hypothetical protein|uniref:hypothetical protein n=1 Tax=Stappia sp. TaxID=1870903 RepID=UPI003C7AE2BD
MSIITEKLWERFFNRLPEQTANDAIRILKRGGSAQDVDYFTLKEAEAQVARYRVSARSAIASYKAWKAGRAVRLLFGVFREREGAHLRAHARAMTALFLDARRDHSDLTRLLMASMTKDTPGQAEGGRHE